MKLDLKELIEKLVLNAVVEDISGKITLGGAWTNVGKVAYRVGKVCYFYIEAYTPTTVGGAEYTIATIAADYRPRATVAHTGHTTNDNFLAQGIINTFVKTNGNITVRPQNGNGQYFFISGWWILP